MKTRIRFTVCLVLILWCAGESIIGEMENRDLGLSVNIPGSVERFEDFFQYPSLTENNFLFYINEIFLWEQLPGYRDMRLDILLKAGGNAKKRERLLKLARKNHGFLLNRTSSYKLREIFTAHRHMESVFFHADKEKISLNLQNTAQFEVAKAHLLEMGLILEQGEKPRYRLVEHYASPHFNVNWYYRIGCANLLDLEKQINETGHLVLEIKHSPVPLPRDLAFFRDVTGLELTPDSFMETLSRNKALQVLTGITFRLSDSEIAYLDGLKPPTYKKQKGNDGGTPRYGRYWAWKEIYGDHDFLNGFFLLCHALRVKDNALVFRGGEREKRLWMTMAQVPPGAGDLGFLRQLATLDHGKLVQFYVFSYFLPETTRRTFLGDFNPERFGQVYRALSLERSERIDYNRVVQLRDFNLFGLLFALRTETVAGKSRIRFPGGLDAWTDAVGAVNGEKNLTGLLVHLLKEKHQSKALERFTVIYSKFHDREKLLTPGVLKKLYDSYDDYNVVIDFLEKIPVKKPGSVLKLLNWVKSFESTRMQRIRKQSLRGLVQSLLEIVALRARYSDAEYDYDALIDAFVLIPPSGALAFDRCFAFLENRLGLDFSSRYVDRTFRAFLFPSLSGPSARMKIDGQSYRLEAAEGLRREFAAIMKSQEVCDLSVLATIRLDLDTLAQGKTLNRQRKSRLFRNFTVLPTRNIKSYFHPSLVDLVRPYRDGWLSEQLHDLDKVATPGKKESVSQKEKRLERLRVVIRELKAGCLLHELRHYFVTAVYAAALKHSGPRALLNPDLTRLHDFSIRSGFTPWNDSGYSDKLGGADAYHFAGGLSRLPVTLSAPMAEYLFHRDDTQYFRRQGRVLLYNNLDLFPYPGLRDRQTVAGRLIDHAREFLINASASSDLRDKLRTQLSLLVSGYRYRQVMQTIRQGRIPKLTYSELTDLGLELTGPPPENLNRLGGVYANTFGSLKPAYIKMFPRQLAPFFSGRWTGTEMNLELKLKAAYFSYKQDKPPQMLGALLYRFLFNESPRLRQWYQNDYYHVDDLFKVYDSGYLDKLYDSLRKTGLLRIK